MLLLLDGARERSSLGCWVSTVDCPAAVVFDKVNPSAGSALLLVLGPHGGGGCCCAVVRTVASSTAKAARSRGVSQGPGGTKAFREASAGQEATARWSAWHARQKLLSISSSHFSSAQNMSSSMRGAEGAWQGARISASDPTFSRRSCLAARSDIVGGGDLKPQSLGAFGRARGLVIFAECRMLRSKLGLAKLSASSSMTCAPRFEVIGRLHGDVGIGSMSWSWAGTRLWRASRAGREPLLRGNSARSQGR